MVRSRTLFAIVAAFLLAGAACTSSTYVSSESPGTSPSPSASESPSPSPSPTPTGPLTITATPVHDGELGQAFADITLSASGGVQPYSWAVGAGALPPGLNMSAQGVISGQVTKAGAFKFTAAVADSGGSQATKATAISVFQALTAKGTCTQSCVVGQGCAKCGTFGSATGGAPPLVVTLVAGDHVPTGMTLSGLSVKGGFPAGNWSLTAQITDKLGVKTTVPANWSVYSPAILTSGGDCAGSGTVLPQSCTVRWTYTGGSPSVAPQVVVEQVCTPAGSCSAPPTNMPASWSAKASGGVVTLTASTPVACNSPSYQATLTLALKDPSTCATTALSAPVALNVTLSNSC